MPPSTYIHTRRQYNSYRYSRNSSYNRIIPRLVLNYVLYSGTSVSMYLARSYTTSYYLPPVVTSILHSKAHSTHPVTLTSPYCLRIRGRIRIITSTRRLDQAPHTLSDTFRNMEHSQAIYISLVHLSLIGSVLFRVLGFVAKKCLSPTSKGGTNTKTGHLQYSWRNLMKIYHDGRGVSGEHIAVCSSCFSPLSRCCLVIWIHIST